MSPGDERDEGSAPQPVLTVAAVARRLGVAPSTLRTWDRRYDLGPSTHTAGSHRRYSVNDLARLVVMRGLVQEGVPPAEAAQIASTEPVAPLSDAAFSGADQSVPGRGSLEDMLLDDTAFDRLLPEPGGVHALPDPGLVTSIPVARGEGEWGRHDVLADLSRGLVAEPEPGRESPEEISLPGTAGCTHCRCPAGPGWCPGTAAAAWWPCRTPRRRLVAWPGRRCPWTPERWPGCFGRLWTPMAW
jgi:DNA-binding transcriptional MerR regulator